MTRTCFSWCSEILWCCSIAPLASLFLEVVAVFTLPSGLLTFEAELLRMMRLWLLTDAPRLSLLDEEALPQRVRALSPHFEAAVHSLADAPGVVSIRNIGLAAGIELAPNAGAPGQRGNATQVAAFDRGLLTRAPGDTVVLAPPFTSSAQDIDRMVDLLRAAIQDSHRTAT